MNDKKYEIPVAPGFHNGLLELDDDEACIVVSREGAIKLKLPQNFGDAGKMPDYIKFVVSLFQLICDDARIENKEFSKLLFSKWNEINKTAHDVKLHFMAG